MVSTRNLADRSGVRPGADDFPEVFGKYVLLRPMAKGGMGQLYLAASGETGGFEKLCVVKKVLPDIDDPGVRRRFLDEAKVVVRLNHANLVQVFDAGMVGDEHYLAMELVEGKDLRAVWNRCAQLHRRIPVDFAIFVARELCRGLDYVHDAMGLDLVHRDISPPNLLVGYHGEVKITDFGLAKHAIKRELTSPGVVFGRYSYLSPEQARGMPADRRTDIYAAGIVLWEMLTGRQLFPSDGRGGQGPALSVLRNPTIRRPSELVPGIPDGLDDVVLRALAVEREERYGSASEFRADLSEILAVYAPTCDVDRVAALMGELFAREKRLESQDYASYSREDFSRIRAQTTEDTVTVSITDVLDITDDDDDAPLHSATETIDLADADIEELQRFEPGGGWEAAPSQETLEEAARARVGKVVARRYRVDRLLGVGGMGAVYEVTHLALGKTYALKVLHQIYGRDPDLIDRFMREARAATQTGHPNIIDVMDIGTMEGGDLFFVMELLDGTDLLRLINQGGPMAFRRAVFIARQIARAVGAAHEAGIIHRDLKSENVVLVDKDGETDFVKVLDFGICKQVDGGDSAKTTPGMVMGSPDYMAPEQAAGAEANAASDVYALGTILFFMLTGRLPFKGRNAIDVLMKKGGGPAPRVREFRPDVPEALDEVVARCLERDVKLRPRSMREVEYELTRAVEGRASAVAAVMGLRLPEEEATPPPREPASVANDPRAADRSLTPAQLDVPDPASAPDPLLDEDAETGKLEPAAPALLTEHDRARASASASQSGATTSQVSDAPRRTFGSGLKALLFVVLGVCLAVAVLYGFGKELLGIDMAAIFDRSVGLDDAEMAAAKTGGEAVAETDGVEALALGGDTDTDTGGGPLTAEGTGGAEPALAEGDTGTGGAEAAAAEPAPRDAGQLVALGEAALESEHWREPVEGSLAALVAELTVVDPTNEAIDEFKREAVKAIRPVASRALKKEKWGEAVVAYRDWLAFDRDDDDVRRDYQKALLRHGYDLRRDEDHEGALEMADTILEVNPKSFYGLRLRAQSLESLERWEEAVPAYRAAMRVKKNHKATRKGYWRARKMLSEQQ